MRLRPHYHAIMFNFRPPDERRLMNGKFRSDELEEVWRCGQVDVGTVTPASCAYVAGYAAKKWYGRDAAWYEDVVDLSTGEVTARRPEFCVMSKGIGAGFYARFSTDMFPTDRVVMDGRSVPVPRYYGEKYKKENPMMWDEVQMNRFLRAEEHAEDLTPERLEVRNEYDERQQAFYESREDL